MSRTNVESQTGSPSPKVLVSYSHDSEAHVLRVAQFSDQLRSAGIDVVLDQDQESPPEGWPRWMERWVRDATYVLVVCTATYSKRAEDRELPGKGLGVRWESTLAYQYIYEAGAKNDRFLPVLFEDEDLNHIPVPLRGATHYRVGTDRGYEALYRRLSGQPRRRLVPLGSLTTMSQDPLPQFPDSRSKELWEALSSARQRKKRLGRIGASSDTVDHEIARLRQEYREGGRLREGDTLDGERFLLLRRVGSGGFGTVWEAQDTAAHARVAIKVLHPEAAADPFRLDRFLRGARKMAELADEGVVRVLRSNCVDSGFHYFVMEFADGGDLSQAVRNHALTADAILKLIVRVGEVLAAAHARGIVHRDVKPANILLDGGSPLLADFDLVGCADTTGGTRTGALGTVIYAAPELLQHPDRAGPPADVYGLAMTALFAISGEELDIDILQPATRAARISALRARS